MSAFNLEMYFTNCIFNISGMMDFPKDVIDLTALVLVALMALFAFKCLTQILDRRTNLDVDDNESHLRANFAVDTITNVRAILNILRIFPVNQISIRSRRPLKQLQ
jgi:hypothetical protein